MPVFSHVLMLKAARVFFAGIKREALNSTHFSNLFDEHIRVVHSNRRYVARLLRRSRKVI
jgi:hypothetical protein